MLCSEVICRSLAIRPSEYLTAATSALQVVSQSSQLSLLSLFSSFLFYPQAFTKLKVTWSSWDAKAFWFLQKNETIEFPDSPFQGVIVWKKKKCSFNIVFHWLVGAKAASVLAWISLLRTEPDISHVKAGCSDKWHLSESGPFGTSLCLDRLFQRFYRDYNPVIAANIIFHVLKMFPHSQAGFCIHWCKESVFSVLAITSAKQKKPTNKQ